jgi:hypothetical protein
MLIYSMGVSVDGLSPTARARSCARPPSEEQFRFHTAHVRELGGYLLGRRLYETMLVWETDPSMRDSELRAAAKWNAACRPAASIYAGFDLRGAAG